MRIDSNLVARALTSSVDAARVIEPTVHAHAAPLLAGEAALKDAGLGANQLRVGIAKAESVEDTAADLIDTALRERGVTPTRIDLDTLSYDGEQLLQDGVPIDAPDVVVTRHPGGEENVNKVRQLREHGVDVVNDDVAMMTTYHKDRTKEVLQELSPTQRAVHSPDEIDAALADLNDKVVVKPHNGEGGKGVEFFHNHEEAAAHLREQMKDAPHPHVVENWHTEPVVKLPDENGVLRDTGTDFRVVFVRAGSELEPVMILQRFGKPGSLKSNIGEHSELGTFKVHQLKDAPAGLIEHAKKSVDRVPGHYDVGGADVIKVGAKDGGWKTVELNSCPGIDPAIDEEARVPPAIADHVIERAVRAYSG